MLIGTWTNSFQSVDEVSHYTFNKDKTFAYDNYNGFSFSGIWKIEGKKVYMKVYINMEKEYDNPMWEEIADFTNF